MKVEYICDICGSRYESSKKARLCEARPMIDMKQGNFINKEDALEPAVGDVVECAYPALGKWDGDPAWSAKRLRGGRFLDGYYNLWVVAAKIPAGDRHVWTYVLWSPSNQHGDEDICWTGPHHHQMYANRVATAEELRAAQAAYAKVEHPRRIPLL
jgi:hypothetical protein